ncbi:3,4-dehydroadipyl-CoA semialdehyde dehydrogenase [Sandaracinus amylolyticus]|uniref:3,4-dehydroadipyl-CoA semialdehyde dehydrogenase n=1 Tax=Sandaracinus amylolyticus TaxID=927083 RepID=UPI001F409261|nr:3,4-dehydroadipyl-CoA semialdehyde dehydrogenase [Sandaracinus amylolyticus]UJR79217.1 Phenylacetic acid degradation bifunctional protein PaaZ [Sandaracinus amylolyticus]
MITLKSYLRGEWVAGTGRGTALVNPTTEEPIAEASTQGLDLGAALEFARTKGGPALRAATFAQRGAWLDAISKALHARRDALLDESIASCGTTRSDAKFDVDGAIGTLAYYAGLGKKLGETTTILEPAEQLTKSARFFGAHVWTAREGVAVHVNAFNFPAWGLGEKLAVALLAGVPVISKPATSTALLAMRVAEAIVDANVLPPGAFQFVAGSTGDLLDKLGPQDVLAFTGSADTGAKLRGGKGPVERSVRVNIEADSLNSAVLAPDVEPGSDVYATFLRDVVREMTQKTGQKCTATRRIFVPAAVIDRVQEDLAEQLGAIKVGDPARDDVRMGPLATKQQHEDFRSGIAKLVASGARVVHTREVSEPKGYFVAPTLLRADAPASATAVHAHEVFGPSATLMPYAQIAECVKLVAMGEGGLVASVYGDDRALLRELVLGIAPWHGRVVIASSKVADQSIAPGMVLPSCVHGGPGRAGGGEELGGERGLRFYMQRTSIQADRALIDKLFEQAKAE